MMIKKLGAFIFLVVLILILTPTIYAGAPGIYNSTEKSGDVEGNIEGPIHGNMRFIDDSTVSFSRDYSYYSSTGTFGAISAGSSFNITAISGKTITINLNGPTSNPSGFPLRLYGIESLGGTVDFSENQVIVDSNCAASLYANKGLIKVGDNSIITSISAAIGAYDNGIIQVGDYSRIEGKVDRDATIKSVKGNITIGTNAYVSNTQRSINDDGLYHYGVWASSGGIVTIGSNSEIYTSSDNTGNIGIKADDENTIVTLGNNSSITTNGSSDSYGIDARNKATVELQYGSTITTNDDKGYGILAYKGSKVILGDFVKINTNGITAYGIYVNNYFQSGSDITYSLLEAGDNLEITTKEASACGIVLNNSGKAIVGDNYKIETSGEKGFGIYLYSSFLGMEKSKITTGENGKIISNGKSAHGIYSLADTDAKLGKVTIETRGLSSHGIFMSDTSTISLGLDSEITTKNNNSHGVVIPFGAFFSIGAGSKITTEGSNSDALYFTKGPKTQESMSFDSMTLRAEKGYIITNAAEALLDITFINESLLYGDISAGYDLSDMNVMLKDETIWEGGGNINNDSYINIFLEDIAKWRIVGSSSFTSLTVHENTFTEFLHITDDYATLTLEKLEGNGNIVMNVDMTNGDSKSNFIQVVSSASGNSKLIIKHNGNAGALAQQLIQVDDPFTNVSFSLDTGTLIISKYVYRLDQISQETTNNQQWWLVLDHTSDELIDDPIDAIFGLFEFAKAIDASLSDDFLRPRNDWWFIAIGKDQKYDKSILNSTMEQQIGGAIIGKDKVYSQYLNAGLFAGTNVGYQQIGDVGSVGHILDTTVGSYVNYARWGLDASAYVRADYYRHNLRIVSTSNDIINATISTYGFSVSAEALYKFGLFNDLFYIGPKAKATFTYLANKPYDFGNGNVMNVHYERGLVSWLGARIGREQYNSYDKKWGYYFEAGWIHDTNPTLIVINAIDPDSEIKTEIGHNRYEVGIGIDTSPLGKGTFSIEIKYAWGIGIVEPLKLKISGSWNF